MRFLVKNIPLFIQKSLYWAETQPPFMFLNGNNYTTLNEPFPVILACGASATLNGTGNNSFKELETFKWEKGFPLFGFLSYDLKNQLENLESTHTNILKFPPSFFFQPEHLLHFSTDYVEIFSPRAEKIFEAIKAAKIPDKQRTNINFTPDMGKEEYIKKVCSIQKDIENGEVYELNFCMNFSASDVKIVSVNTYVALSEASPTPFSCLFSSDTHSIISASPERFLKKSGTKIIAQPMKGTIKRGATKEEDLLLIEQLRNSEKEIAENMMITDLLRNDLAKSCETGSVQVEDAFGIYPFPSVYQMISTVTGTIKKDIHPIEVIKNAFPMGSMTGAPKIRAMELIDTYENSFRGAYSGAAGFITKDGDFDLNVLIRSMFYNKTTQTLSFSVGSAITYDSNPELEYEECLLKAERIFKVMGGNQ